jgi:uncharacterized protein
MIKIVMGTIMIIVAVSRALAVPQYLTQLGLMSASDQVLSFLNTLSFVTMCLGLGVGAVIILGAMIQGKRAEAIPAATESYEHA